MLVSKERGGHVSLGYVGEFGSGMFHPVVVSLWIGFSAGLAIPMSMISRGRGYVAGFNGGDEGGVVGGEQLFVTIVGGCRFNN